MIHAAALLYPEALATSVTLPAEILHAAAQLARAQRRPAPDGAMRLLGLDDADHIALDSGLTMQLDGGFGSLELCDLLILPAIWRHPRRVLARCRPLLPRLRALHDRGVTICSVGSASALLAEAGILDGRVATTHWHDFERFARAYPQVDLRRRHLITQSEHIYCVGSVNSIGDFMVHMIDRWYGDTVARAVERQFSPEARQSFDTAAFLQQSPGAHHDAVIRDAQDRMQQHPEDAHSLSSLAAAAGLSERSFGRRFQRATGTTPLRYLLSVRLREARALLQHSDLSIADVAWRCGFSSPSRFAQQFREHVHASPREFRSAVRGKRFTDADSGD